MGDLNAPALHVLQRQSNVISFDQLRRCGITKRQRDRLITDGVLAHVGKSVLCVRGTPFTLEVRLIALCLQHPQGYVTGVSGGVMMALRRMPPRWPITFGLPHGARADMPPGVRLRRTTVLPPDHVRDLPNGIRIASPARLAFDLAAHLRPRAFRSVLEQLVNDGHCTDEELGAMARLLCARGRPGSALFATSVVARRGRAASQSDAELEVLEGLRRRNVPVVPQVGVLELPNGRQVHIDLAVEELRWAVEIDLHPRHLGLVGTSRDKQRDRQLHMIGWQVERVTQLDLLDANACFDELAALYEARRRALAA